MCKYAVILAGGEGTRAGAGMPKQFVKLLGIPMLWWSVRAFHQADPDTEITIVMHPGFFDMWDIVYSELPAEDKSIPVRLVCGGKNRTHSVMNGIMALPADPDSLIAVHDAARPLITPEWVTGMWHEAQVNGTAIPVVPEVNSMRRCMKDGSSEPVDRAELVVVQTPQIFRADILKKAYEGVTTEGCYTDDAILVQMSGFPIHLCKGLPMNLKVTNPIDFHIAEVILKDDPLS